jgi:hypothetical protein
MQEPKNIGELSPKTITRILAAIDQCTVDNNCLSLRGIDLSPPWSDNDKICVLNHLNKQGYIR